jgi:alpha-methylacyl-CoA racemase
MAVGAIEPRFFSELVARLGLDAAHLPAQHDRARWPELRERFAQAFGSRTRAEWCAVFADADACVAPVLTFGEAAAHPHAQARGAHVTLAGVLQPAPAPRFERTPGAARTPPPQRGQGGREALRAWGFDEAAVARLAATGVRFAG